MNTATAKNAETPQQAARRLARATIRGEFKPAALHAYCDEKGEPIYWRIRARLPDGSKFIRPMKQNGNGNGYELGEPVFASGKPLYRLHELAAKAGVPVWFAEGENCADALARLGVLATTAGGATSDDKANFSPLAGRKVTIWPDADKPGAEHGERVAAKARTLGCKVETIDTAALGLPEGGDVVDWLRANPNATAGDLAKLPRVNAARASDAAAPDDCSGARATAESEREHERKHPEIDPAAFYGLAGEIVQSIAPDTESDPVAILAQVLVAFGAHVGRGSHCRVEADEHHPNLFVILVGATSKARKGTSWGRVLQIYGTIPEWPRVESGLSSGEGLKYAVRDPVMRPEKDRISGTLTMSQADPGIADKRLLVREAEFVQAIRQAARPGNVLSAVIREAWDSGTLRTLTKTDQITATGAHISIIGHITADELRADLTATDTANGFANRFLFVAARRSKLLPFGGEEFPQEVREGFTKRLQSAAAHARSLGRRVVAMTPAARSAWAAVYPSLSEGSPGLYGSVTARAEAQVVRLALVYALLDSADQIDKPHLTAAIALWEYCAASAAYIFGDALGDPVADDLLAALRLAGASGMTRTQIRDHFGRNQRAERISAALELLRARRYATVERRTDTGGAPVEVWKAQR